MNIKDLTLIERLTVRMAQFIMYAFIFTLFAVVLFLLTDSMIDYLTLGQYDINTL